MTRQLPPALAPWAAELGMFPFELAVDLGAIVRRLSSAVGPPVTARHRGDDPDGFDGILRSGPYDRMLHSEWLLADELPDEFLRRAVMREHLFFRLARRSSLDDMTCVALVDAGPAQIGAPRLVHVALLIVLARRCAERGGTFRWATLQGPRHIHDRLDQAAVRNMLSLRSTHEVTEEELDRWADLLPHGDRRHRETWMIGSERLTALVERHAHRSGAAGDFREVSLVSVEEPLDFDSRELAVSIRDARGARRRLTLQLPAERQAIRLIRDPFDPVPARVTDRASRTKHVEIDGGMFFTAGGKRLLARSPGGGIYVHIVRGHQLSMKEYRPRRGEPVIAAGHGLFGGASISIVRYPEPRLRHASLHRQEEGQLLVVNGSFPWDRTDTLSPLARNLFLDVDGVCWRIAGSHVVRMLESCAALSTHDGKTYVAQQLGDKWHIIKVENDRPEVLFRFDGTGTGAFFGTPAASSREKGLLMAVEERPGLWIAASETSVRNYACPPGARVIGVTLTKQTRDVALVIAEPGGVALLAGQSLLQVFRTAVPVANAAFDSSSPLVAHVIDGRMGVTSIESLWLPGRHA